MRRASQTLALASLALVPTGMFFLPLGPRWNWDGATLVILALQTPLSVLALVAYGKWRRSGCHVGQSQATLGLCLGILAALVAALAWAMGGLVLFGGAEK